MAQGLGGSVTEVEIGGFVYRIHTFTESGTFQVTAPGVFEYLVIGGGGAGGVGGGTAGGGGGGAGGLLRNTTFLSANSYSVVVGAGGLANQNDLAGEDGLNGQNSSFFNAAALGGGGGAGSAGTNGKNGGSGGGGRGFIVSQGGLGTTGQGFDGGTNTITGAGTGAAGGGGAGSAGSAPTTTVAGAGGLGYDASDFGLNLLAGGGGGGAGNNTSFGLAVAGGGSNALSGVNNTGGGGAGGNSDFYGSRAAGDGGSGVVSIRYQLPSSKIILSITPNKTEVQEGEEIIVSIVTENYEDNETLLYNITGDVDQNDIDIGLSGQITITNNQAELRIKTLRNDKTEDTEQLILFIGSVSITFLIFNFNPEFIPLSQETAIVYTSSIFPKTVDLTASSNLTNISILSQAATFRQLIEDQKFYTSVNFKPIIDLSIPDFFKFYIIILDTNFFKFKKLTDDFVDITGKVFYATDFVSITNFNVPDPVPLVFPERWAG
jgi:hypothetical protein